MNKLIKEIFINFLKEEMDQLSDDGLKVAIFIFIYLIKSKQTRIEIGYDEIKNGTCIDNENIASSIFIAPTNLSISDITSAIIELIGCDIFNITHTDLEELHFIAELNFNHPDINYYFPTYEEPEENKRA